MSAIRPSRVQPSGVDPSGWFPRVRVWSSARVALLGLFALATLLVVGCAEENKSIASGGGGADGGGAGNNGSGGDGHGNALDAFQLPDYTVRGDMTHGGSGFQEPCLDNRDCLSGWCVPFQDHYVCTQRCLDEGCPGAWSCHAVANTVPDVVFICFPPDNRLCGVCLGDADCPGGRCYTLDGQDICGLDCEADETCPPDYECKAVLEDPEAPKQCTAKTGSCTCNISHESNERVCENTNMLGGCFGHQICDPKEGWSDCSAPTPVTERCNLVDDDCNGLTDDIAGLGEVCEHSVDLDGRTASCAGRLICTRESEEPVCTAQQPKAEACNYLDDDCDGDTDEEFPELGTICEVGVGTCRRVGVVECTDDAVGSRCNVVEGAPGPERCDGLDNDCDGEADEDFAGLNEPCFNGVGGCRRAAALRCSADASSVECAAIPGEPEAEVCDGIDNNCDGTLDEGFDGLFEPCDAGAGGCRRTGFLYCTDDARRVECTAVPAEPTPEVCNGVDDDCNGAIDETFPRLNTPCTRGQGLCQHAGVNLCNADGSDTFCNAPESEPQEEACDGLDNDCDALVDEDFVDLDTVCSAGRGACLRIGIVTCSADGSGAACSAEAGAPMAETCDGLDNDCNGQADEAFVELNRPCNVGVGACLRYGVSRCAADGSATECNAVTGVPEDERCDRIDNNCDGTVDEGFEDVDQPCNVGIGACARAGVTTCSDDGQGVVCDAAPGAAAAERCNALDDNCDGRVDETFDDLFTPCEAGVGECHRVGVRVCSDDGDGTRCTVSPGAPDAEACDSRDNDCDGRIDEDFATLSTPCSAGRGECLRPGVNVCSDDGRGVTCNAAAGAPVPELCDGRDNNCNGALDEGFVGIGAVCEVGTGLCARTGVQICAPDGSAVVCNVEPGPATDEICDAVDDNCDGVVDEGFEGLGEGCTAGLGICARGGVQVCSADGADVICDARPAAPGARELCNGLDDTCDGRTDEGFAGLRTVCNVGVGACARVGVNVCSDDGRGVACDVDPGQPVAERCDSVDNNCDGRTDEGFAALGTPCSAGRGTCQRAGVNVCSADGGGVTCNAVAAAPAPADLCNGLDDDCDGRVDETFVDLNTPCSVGIGACVRPGVRVCAADGSATECNAVVGNPVVEVCDAIDNNCDGRTDEATANLGQVCNVGNGICRRSGVNVCNPANRAGAAICDAVPGNALPAELCNGADDNCNGATDEGFATLGNVCNVGVGACTRAGVNICSNDGSGVTCNVVAGNPAAERCDSVDNDCNGRTDESFPSLGTPCSVGRGICQRAGVNVCSGDGAGIVCNAVAAPAAPAELCNGLDDDCDGSTDETFPDLNTACSAGVGACVRAGVRTCAVDGSATACNAVAGNAAAEVCDGIDNNCEGRVDESTANLGQVCNVGTGSCRRSGVNVCNPANRAGAAICDAVPGNALPAELCNGADDDCDGLTDEGFPALGTVCNVGTGACARAGVNICSVDGSGISCNVSPGNPVAERCDSVDNDCNGRTDETYPTLGTPCSAGRGICQRAGVNVCSADGNTVGCNASPGAAAGAELCNGLDDDCDGSTDETFADLNTACAVGIGACLRNGVKNCSGDGLSTACNAVAGAAAAEICDAIDNNCEGRVDELTANLGQACNTGLGICRRSGVYVCNAANRAGAAICDAVAGVPPDGTEDCDYQDDNCNGQTDEGFLDAQSRYVAVANCGSCGNNCNNLWGGNPAAFGLTPRCAVVNNLAQCQFTCLAGYLDADRVSNNGCELLVDAGAVYVSTPANGGADVAACGAVTTPCATIQNGIARAVALVRPRVLVSDGVYTESVTLSAGISVLGGHHRTTWFRDPDLNVTIIDGRTVGNVNKKAVLAIGITVATTLDGFVINGESALTTGNSYAIYVRDSNSNLHITNNRIFAGNGGRGTNGSNGVVGQIGVGGSAGKTSFNTLLAPLPVGNPVCSPDPGAAVVVYTGGAGGARACGAVSANGGAGGGSKCPRRERQEGTSGAGQTAPRGGAGGVAPWDMDGTTAGNGGQTCTVSVAGPIDATPGAAGSDGTDAVGGAGAAAGAGTVAANEWQGTSGSTGGAAITGGGGGGGSSAPGVRDLTLGTSWDIGATGGGGGSGGCQGNSGAGGAPGGGSFGIFVVFTGGGPANAAGVPDIRDNEIWRGLGGTGGDGGNGGPGGEGGVGGAGGSVGAAAALLYDFCSFKGALGGKGGRGGHGGGGGGGLGGASYDIFVYNENGLAPDFGPLNSFGVPAGQATGGPRGEGGASLNIVTGLGAAGNAGAAGNLTRIP